MNQLAIIRRHLTILRLVQPPFLYPSKVKILERLQAEDLESVSQRTFERDIKEIEKYYGIKVTHCPRRRGYYLHQPADEDPSNFQQFVQLLERSERLAFLTHSADALRTSKYVLLEENHAQQGLQHLPVLWEALRRQRQLAFYYQTFNSSLPKPYQLDPLLLLEYRNRWYLAAWDATDARFKTFGLERMQEPQLTAIPVQTDRCAEFLTLKQDALGVFIGPDHSVQQVVLWVDAQMTPYIKTVPIHPSQTVIEEMQTGMTISLRVLISPELEREILGYAEHIEVLEPMALREKIKERVLEMTKRYDV